MIEEVSASTARYMHFTDMKTLSFIADSFAKAICLENVHKKNSVENMFYKEIEESAHRRLFHKQVRNLSTSLVHLAKHVMIAQNKALPVLSTIVQSHFRTFPQLEPPRRTVQGVEKKGRI